MAVGVGDRVGGGTSTWYVDEGTRYVLVLGMDCLLDGTIVTWEFETPILFPSEQLELTS